MAESAAPAPRQAGEDKRWGTRGVGREGAQGRPGSDLVASCQAITCSCWLPGHDMQ